MKSLYIIQDPIYSVLEKSCSNCSSLSKRIHEHSLSQISIEDSSLTSITRDEYLSDDDLIHSFYEQNQTIRSSIDNLSLNSSVTLSIPLFDQQTTKHEQIKTNTDDDEDDDNNDEDVYDIIIDQQNIMLHDQEIREDNSHNLDELRYSSRVTNGNCSSLREEALSITKVRCKQRETWCNKQSSSNSTKNVKTPSYDFIRLNSSDPIIKTNESIVSPLSKTNNIHDKDGLTSNTKINNIYLIHHQSSLVSKENLFASNIEFSQMDDKECTLEIIDGVVTLVPKEQDKFDHMDDEEQDEIEEEEEEEDGDGVEDRDDEQQYSVEYETSQNYDSPEREKRSSTIESSISTPSISEHEQEQNHSLSISNTNEQSQEPFILLRDPPSKASPLPTQVEQSVDLLDLFSTPLVPSSNSPTNIDQDKMRHTKNLLDDSLSSISFEEQNPSQSEASEKSPSPIVLVQQENLSKHSSPSTSIKEEEELSSNQIDEPEIDYPLPKSEPPPAAKPINKARINEFASLLSSAVHLSQPVNTKPPSIPVTAAFQSETRRLSNSERDSYHTIPSNTTSESEETKKHIDARYNEKIDDRKSIQINSSNIKALFEHKISEANKILAQSNEQLTHIQENKQHYRKAPVSYAYVNKQNTQPIIRRQSFQDSTNMNKHSNQLTETKDILIEDKQPEHGTHQTQSYSSRRNNTEQIVRSNVDSTPISPVQIANGYYSESLIAREIRETKEKEEALRQQRKKCGLPEDVSALLPPRSQQETTKSEQSTKPPVKSSSFLSNLDFFTSKSSESNVPPRRSTVSIQNLVYDSQNSSFNDERRTSANQESTFLSAQRTNSIQRTSSNQNLLSPQTKSNIIQREIEAMRAKESELRELGRIQHTSDDHSDPRKYQEIVPPIPKSQSANVLSSGKLRKDADKFNVSILPNSNGILKPKTMNNNSNTSAISSLRGRFPSPNPTAPIVSSSNKSIDYSKLSSAERLELEKREMQERELELRKQRHPVSGNTSTGNYSTINGDSGNVSQDEDEHENYFDKIQRLKRTENEKAQVPLQRPVKKSNLSQKWEQMVANKNNNSSFSDDHN